MEEYPVANISCLIFNLQNNSVCEYWNLTGDDITAWSLSEFSTTCFTFSLALIILLGIIGNAIVIYVSLRISFNRGLTSTIDVYILHLSVADFLFLIFCVPFQGTVYIMNDWIYGLSMCKLAHYCQYVTMYASIWILTLMSIDRYVAIGHPLRSVKWRTIERATRSSIAVWAVATVLSSPLLFLYTTVEYPDATVCYDYWGLHIDYRKWLILFVFSVSFLIPTLVIFCMALLICSAIQTSVRQPFLRTGSSLMGGHHSSAVENSNFGAGNNRRRRRRVVWLVFALSAWYLCCWSSHSILLIWIHFDPNAWEWVEENSWVFFVLKIVGHMGTYVHACFNPILYSLVYEQFRKRVLLVFGKKRQLDTNIRSVVILRNVSAYFYGAVSPLAMSRQSTQERTRSNRTQCSRV